MFPSLSPCRSRNILDDFREAYFWLRQNTDDNARYVHVWWYVNYNSPLRSLKGSLKVINRLIYHPLIWDNFSCERKTHLESAPYVRVNWVSCLLIRESFLTAHIPRIYIPPSPTPTTVSKVNQTLLKVVPLKKLWTMTARASDFFPVSVG